MADVDRIRVEITGNSRDLVASCAAAVTAIRGVSREAKSAGGEVKVTTRVVDDHARSVRGATRDHRGFQSALKDTGSALKGMGGHIALLKWPALISGATMAVQVISALGAGAVATTASLSQLAGAAVAIPSVMLAGAQAIGVFKLATAGVEKALQGNVKAMRALTPSARDFVNELHAMKPKLDELRQAAGKGLLPGATAGIKDAMKNFGALRRVVADTGTTLGRLAKDAGKLVGSKAWGRDIKTIGERNQKTLRDLGHGALDLADALRNVVVAGGPFVSWLTGSARQLAQHVDQWTAAARQSGQLATYFDRARRTLVTVAQIGSNVAHVLADIGHAALPLGDDILHSLDKASAGWRTWTHSIQGQQALADYFNNAKPAIYEAAGLVADVSKGLASLGSDSHLAPLIHQIRTELLPAVGNIISGVGQAFGPALISMLTQVAKLIGDLGGAGGPLTIYARLLTDAAQAVDWIVRNVPGMKEFATAAVLGLGAFDAFKIGRGLVASAIAGVKALIVQFKILQAAAAGASAAELAAMGAGAAGGGAAIGGAAAGVASKIPIYGARGQVISTVERGGGAAAAGGGLFAGGLAGAAGKALGKIGGGSALGGLARVGVYGDIGVGIVKGIITGVHKGMSVGAQEALHSITLGLTPGPKDFSKQDKRITDDIDRIGELAKQAADARHLGIHLNVDFKHGQVDEGVQIVLDQIKHMGDQMASSLADVRLNVAANMRAVKLSMTKDPAAARDAIAATFNAAAASIKKAMDAGVISTKDGLAAINKYTRKALAQYGITGARATGYLAVKGFRDNNPGSSGTGAGGAAGGALVQYGRPGDAGADQIPARIGGRDLMVGSGEVGMVLNRHQQQAANMALAKAYGWKGGLRDLFHNVKRKHYLAGGGFVADPGTNFSAGREPQIAARLDRLARFLHTTIYGISGWRSPQHSVEVGGFPNDPHTRGEAADIGVGSQARSSAARLTEALLERFGLTRPFSGAEEINHIQLLGGKGGAAIAGAVGSAVAKAIADVPRVGLSGPDSALKAIVQASLDSVRGAANAQLGGAAPAGGGGGGNRSLGRRMMLAAGWGDGQWPALNALWTQESGWNANAVNKSSGAYGIPQALGHGHPFDLGDARAQIAWGLNYIRERYGSPSAAEAHEKAFGWYAGGGFTDPTATTAKAPDWVGQQIAKDNKKKAAAKKKKRVIGAAPPPIGARPGRKKRKPKTPFKHSKQYAAIQRVFKGLGGGQEGTDGLPDPASVSALLDGMRQQWSLVDESQTIQGLFEIASGKQVPAMAEYDPAVYELRDIVNQSGGIDASSLHYMSGIDQHVGEDMRELGADQQIEGVLHSRASEVTRRIAQRLELLKEIASLAKLWRERKAAAKKREEKERQSHGTWKDRVAGNTEEIDALEKWLRDNGQANSQQAKDFKVKARDRVAALRSENARLREDKPAASKIAGRAAKDVAFYSKELDGLSGMTDPLTTQLGNLRSDADGIPAALSANAFDQASLRKDIADWSGTVLPAQAKGAGGDLASQIKDLTDQLNAATTEFKALDNAQNPVFNQFLKEIAGGLPYLGSFDRGNRRVHQTGLAIVHQDEQIVPDREGPYGSQIVRGADSYRAGDVNLHLHGDIGSIIRQALAEHEGRVIRLVDKRLGRESRQLSYAPG